MSTMLTSQDDPLIDPDETLSPGGLKYRKKRLLKERLKKTFMLGGNSIEVVQISNKYVKISEVFNGLNQEHRRYTIDNALDYLEYRESQFMMWPAQIGQIDLTKQNKQYQQQYENVEELQIDLMNYLDLSWKSAFQEWSSHNKWSRKIEFDKNKIFISFETGYVFEFTWHEKGGNRFQRFTISHNIPASGSSYDFWVAQSILHSFSKLMYQNEDMMHLFESQVQCHAQLQKLYTEPVDRIDPTLLADLHLFIQNANDTYSYPLKPVNGFERELQVKRISDKRTAVKVIASQGDTEFCEYRKDLTKVQHQIEANAKLIGTIAENHNY